MSLQMRQVIKDGEGAAAAAADLTLNLLPELLQLIASKLTNICDYIRFRCVCTRWRSSATTGGPHRWLPWLILPLTVEGDFLPIFNTSDGRFYNLPLPEEVQCPLNFVRGSAYGWLVIAGPYTIPLMKAYLYNPITRACILLPPIPLHTPFQPLLCCNPTTASPGQLLVSVTMDYTMPVLIYRQGDICWTEIEMPSRFTYVRHITYLQEEAKLYALDCEGLLAVLDLSSLTFRLLICTTSPETKWLILPTLVASAGDLLLVASDDIHDPRSVFNVFKLDRDKEGCFKWARAATIGNCTLFVSHIDSVAVICDPDFIDHRANLIYQFDDFSAPIRDDNGASAAIRGHIKLWDLVAGVKFCFEIISKRIKYKNRHSHKFTWMVPNMS